MTCRRRAWSFVVVLLLLGGGAPAVAQTGAPIALSEVTVSKQPDTVSIFVKTSAPPKYQAELIDTPSRLVIDFEDTSYGWRTTPLTVAASPVKQVRGSQYRKGTARLVVELTRRVGYALREEEDGLAIVIPRAATAPPEAAAVTDDGTVTTVAAPSATDVGPTTPTPPRPTVQIAQAPRKAPARPAAPPTPPPVADSQRLISLDFKDADVVNLLRILAAESNRNIVIGDDVKGKMSIALRNVPWQLALDTILESRGLVKTERDGVMRIVTSEQLAKEREARARVEEAKVKAETEIRTKIAEAQLKEAEAQARKLAADAATEEAKQRGPLREETIRLSYADPDTVVATLRGILGIPPGPVGQAGAGGVPGAGPGVIPAPPFSQLFGPSQPLPPMLTAPNAEVLAKGITIQAYKPTNSVFIRHYAADVERIKKLIREKLDIPLPQVKIEARMEILARQDLFAIGVQWGGGGVLNRNQTATLVGRGFTSDPASNPSTLGIPPSPNAVTGQANSSGLLTLANALPVSGTTGLAAGGNIVNLPIGSLLSGAATAGTGGLAFGIIGSRLNLNLALEALRTEGKTRTLARPEVVTVENGKAAVSLGEEIPYATVSSAGTQIQFKEALLRLEVTPTVVREKEGNRIKMLVLVENNSRGTTTINLGSAGSPPVITRRKAETEVLIKEGERLVIGGVTNAEELEDNRKVPMFGDIPVLGWLFKQRGVQHTSTELVVFITPTIIRRDVPAASIPGTTAPTR